MCQLKPKQEQTEIINETKTALFLLHGIPVSLDQFFGQRRTILDRPMSIRPGNPIQVNSLFSTDHPQELKNDLTPIGATWIGVQGKKNRLEEKGQKNATPRPPFVKASRRPWLVQMSQRREK